MLWNMQNVLENKVTLKMVSAVQRIFHVHVPCWHAGFAHFLGAESGRNDGQEGWQQWCDTQGVKPSEDWHRLLAISRRRLLWYRIWSWCVSSLRPVSLRPQLVPTENTFKLNFSVPQSCGHSFWIMGAEFFRAN